MGGSSNRRDLYLQVSANIDALRSNLKDGKSALVAFAGDAAAQIEAVEKALQTMGGDNAAESAKALTDSYSKAFSTIRANAHAVSQSGSGADALGILNVQGAQQAAEAAAQQAAMIRQVAEAASIAALAQGNENQALVAYAAAALTAADDADRYASATRDQAAALQTVQGELQTTVTPLARIGSQSAQSRQGVMVLGEQFRQLGTELALGISPAQAFAQQIGQIGFALTLFDGSLGGVGAFLAGPWGIALTVGAAVLAPFVAKLFEAHDAAVEAKLGSDGLADAQGVLGKMFDLASGKIKAQNELLRLNAELTAVNLRAQAAKEQASSAKTVGSLGTSSWENFFLPKYLGGEIGAAPKQLINMLQSGKLSPADAVKRASTVDMTGSKVSRTDFIQAIVDATSAKFQTKTADDIEQALKTGVLPQDLRETGRTRKPKVDHSAEQAANRDRAYQSELQQAQDRYAKAKLALADTTEGEYAVKIAELQADKAQRDQEIQDQVTAKKITQAQADKLKTLNADTEKLQESKALRDKQSAILNRQLDALRLELDGGIALLQMQSDLATTQAERRRIALQILAKEKQEALAVQQKIIDDPNSTKDEIVDGKLVPGQVTNAKAAQAQINDQFGYQVKLANQQNASPLDAFKLQLHQDTDSMNDALQSVEADGLRSLEDGLLGIIDGTESVASAFKKMASSIIADIARIVIERAILSAIDKGSLFGFKLGGEVEAHATGGMITGPGTGTSDSILARLSNGEFIVTSAATKRFLPVLKAMNDNRLPAFADGGLVGMPANLNLPTLPSAASLARRDDRLHVSTDISVTPSPLFETEVRNTTIQTIGAAAEPIMAGAQTRTIKRISRPSLPGGWG